MRVARFSEQQIEIKDPKEAELWVSVALDDAVVGYAYLPLWEIDAPPETQDLNCHPELAIFDEQGKLIGGFVDGVPTLAEGSDR